MSGPPGHKTFSTAELGFLSSQAAQRAEARTVALEARLAQTEARLAEQDRLISELASGFRQASDTISALSVVVKELQEAGFKGVDQVLTGLEARLDEVEKSAGAGVSISQYVSETLLPRLDQSEASVPSIAAHIQLERRIAALEAKPKRGRPKGSKNKPKSPPVVEQQSAEMDENAPIQQPEGE